MPRHSTNTARKLNEEIQKVALPGKNRSASCASSFMKVPEVKPSDRFLGCYAVPCLKAELRNSDVGLATQVLALFKEDPELSIYLRGKDPESISPWQQKQLERLFEKEGLPAVLIKGFGLRPDYFDADISDEDRGFFAKHGYSPCAYVSLIVIDEIRQKVFLVFYPSFISDHPEVMYLRRGAWCLEDYEYFLSYEAKFERYEIDLKAEEEARRQRIWDSMFPPGQNATAESDCAFVYGRWQADQIRTNEIRKQLGLGEIGIEGRVYLLTASRVESPQWFFGRQVAGWERRGNWVIVTDATKDKAKLKFWSDGISLVEEDGVLYRRVSS
jgi:hypothetical protein